MGNKMRPTSKKPRNSMVDTTSPGDENTLNPFFTIGLFKLFQPPSHPINNESKKVKDFLRESLLTVIRNSIETFYVSRPDLVRLLESKEVSNPEIFLDQHDERLVEFAITTACDDFIQRMKELSISRYHQGLTSTSECNYLCSIIYNQLRSLYSNLPSEKIGYIAGIVTSIDIVIECKVMLHKNSAEEIEPNQLKNMVLLILYSLAIELINTPHGLIPIQ